MQSLHGLHSVILLDQSDRWRNGDKPLVESYLHLVPELGSDKRRLMDVIYQEILLRGAAGEPSSYDEYARRFPELADELRLQFEVHGGLDWEAIDEELPNKEPPSIDAYRIEGELGRGTFGTVYKAWDQKLRRYVAIKLMPDVRSNDSFDEGEPFREAQSIARLTHPNIVQVHAVGTCESGVYFAQELVEGGTLADFIRSRTQPPKEAAEFTALLADAIHYAHINQVLHCDLKPPNVLLRTQPELGTSRAARLVDFQPKLADFGLARQLDTETMVENHHLTGTLQYMAPEQTGVEGAIVGIGADIYALGAVLYELLTGRPPFNDASKLKVFLQVRSEAPIPPRQLSSAIPIDIEAICLKCLNKDPALRYETAAALAEDLRRYVGGYTPLAVKASTIGAGMRWLNREPVVATLLGALVLTAMLGFAMVTQKMFVAQRAEKSERARADELEASLYRNQFRLAWSAFEDANIDQAKKLLKKTSPKHRSFEWFYLHSLFREPKLVTSVEEGRILDVVVSSDEHWIAVQLPDRKVRIFDRLSGKVQCTVHLTSGINLKPVFNNAGSSLAVGSVEDGQGWIQIWEPASGSAITKIGPLKGEPVACRFSADDTQIATVSWVGSSSGFSSNSPASAPPQRRLYFELWNVSTGKLESSSTSDDIRRAFPSMVSLSPDLSRFAWTSNVEPLTFGLSETEIAREGRYVVHLVDTNSGTRTQSLPLHVDRLNGLKFSPDSKSLSSFGDDGICAIWNALDGKLRYQIKANGNEILAIDFSPDGHRLATAGRDPSIGIWSVDSGKQVGLLRCPAADTRALCFLASPARLISGNDDGLSLEWQLDGLHQSSIDVSPAVVDIEYNSERHQLLTADLHGKLNAYHFDKNGRNPSGREVRSNVYGFTIQSNGVEIAALDLEGRLSLGKLDDPSGWRAIPGIPSLIVGNPSCLKFSPNDKFLAGINRATGAVVLVDTTSQTHQVLPMPGGTEVTNVAFSFDGTYLAATSKAPHILVWNLKLGKFVRSIATADRVTDLAFHPTCNDLATAVFYENACIVWNIETGEQRQVIEGHKQRITCLNYTPDGMRLVTGSDDHTLRVWDADSGEELLLIDGAPSWIRQCSISQDGRQLAYFCTTDEIKKSEITILGGSER